MRIGTQSEVDSFSEPFFRNLSEPLDKPAEDYGI
jgi:hypothetical protein